MDRNTLCLDYFMRQYTQLEKFLYEARPYTYGAIAFYALVLANNSWLMMLSGSMLALCCILVSAMRYEHRKQLSLINVGDQRDFLNPHKDLRDRKYNAD